MALYKKTNKKKNSMSRDRIVILGGGFGGIKTALLLSKKLKKYAVDIILINQNSYQVYTPSLYEVATAYRGTELTKNVAQDQDFKGEIGAAIAFDIVHIFSKTSVQLVIDEVVGVDVVKQQVHLKKDGVLEYTYCVVALGSRTAYFGVEGAEQNAIALKDLHSAFAVRDLVKNAVGQVKTTQQPATLAIVGAGLAGFEVATEIATYIKHLVHTHSIDKEKICITLIEARNQALSACSDVVCEKARHRLYHLGVELKTNAKTTKVEKNKITFSDNSSMEVAGVVWGGGVQCLYLKEMVKGDVSFAPSGQIMVTEFLNLPNYQGVFAIGDCSFLEGAPNTAYIAEQQAECTARNIASLINKKSLKKYKPKNANFVVSSAGGKYALADTYFFCCGFSGWLIKRIIDFRYLVSIYPLGTAFKMWYKGIKLFSKND